MTNCEQDHPMEREYGFHFHSQARSHSPGHPHVDVVLRSVPTGKHFDPKILTITAATGHGDTESLRVRHPWKEQEQIRICAGRVIMEDRKGKRAKAFTFGGDLQIKPEALLTTCLLTSPAPILELIGTASIPTLLAQQTEIIFAERRADWEPDQSTFERRLSAADPHTLYCVCLQTLKEKFMCYPSGGDESLQQFVQFLFGEIKTLQELDMWPGSLPAIDKIL